MNREEFLTWVDRIYAETALYAQENQIRRSIFYSYPHHQPHLMIIGDNPGGGDTYIQETYPEKGYHAYIEENWDLANLMREGFFFTPFLKSVLMRSVKLNRNFFGSRSIESLKERGQIRTFDLCRGWYLRIIQELQPKNILAESIGTYDDLRRSLKGKHVKNVPYERGHVRIGHANGVKLIGLYHPTGARTRYRYYNSETSYRQVQRILEQELK